MPVKIAASGSWLRRTCVLGSALLFATILPGASHPSAKAATSASSSFEDTRLDRITVSGLHNAFEESKSGRLTDALDKGARLLEIDVYSTYSGTGGWVVSHSNPLINDNNCTYKVGKWIFQTTQRNGNLRTCLDNLSDWSEAHPDHDPIYIKLELKWGFRKKAGKGPADLDSLIKNHIGTHRIFKPSDMTGTAYPTLDAAAKADAWPTWQQLRGKFILYPITGTIENKLAGYDLDNLSTAKEYAAHVRDLASTGKLDQAMMWPDMHPTSSTGDPRTIYEPSLRPWFVMFDTQAVNWLGGGHDMAWYCSNHYLTTATAAANVPPALDKTNPDPTAAAERVTHLAQHGASAVTHDWMNAPGALTVQSRNC
ncbi:Ca2+-dependent phosphoinositide-specific phospholipase C [Streptomyces sp. NPDC086835]|uniref:Ca2+-dependent phosphoinositide-specific phospholipase C n=1 Tax=Streptomyces sp. NPDC086835 TaxID=3365761 RepID=UPI00380EE4E7